MCGSTVLVGRVFLITLSFLVLAHSLPVNKLRGQTKEKQEPPSNIPGLDMQEYMRYMEEMARNDPAFSERLNKIKDFDMTKLQEVLAHNPHLRERLAQAGQGGGVRNQYDEARRLNIDNMRELQRIKNIHDDGTKSNGDWSRKPPNRKFAGRLPEDYSNTDIQNKLRETQHMLEELDSQRKDEFKAQEMWKEHRRRQRLAEMDEQQRLLAEEKYRKNQDEMKHHQKLPQPGSKEQLEQVWKEEDGMPEDQFDPRTFFHMHDTNGDRVIDQMELEALFINELKKVYKGKDISGLEAHEDMARMREYALSKMDADKNGLLSYDEFQKYMKQGENVHQKNNKEEAVVEEEEEEWHPVVDGEMPYSDKEFEDYEEEYEGDYDYQYDDQGNVIGIIPRQHPAVNEQGEMNNNGLNLPMETIKGDPALKPPIQIDDPNAVHVNPAGDGGGGVGAVDAGGVVGVDGGGAVPGGGDTGAGGAVGAVDDAGDAAGDTAAKKGGKAVPDQL